MLADVVDLDDVGVLEPGDGLGLGEEAGGGLGAGVRAGQDHLQGDGAVEPDLAGLVDDAHAAAAQLAQDLVAGERGVGTPGGGRRRVAIRRRGDGRLESVGDPFELVEHGRRQLRAIGPRFIAHGSVVSLPSQVRRISSNPAGVRSPGDEWIGLRLYPSSRNQPSCSPGGAEIPVF